MNSIVMRMAAVDEDFPVDTRLFSSLIHHTEQSWIWHLFWTWTKAFRAIAPSSVVFQDRLEHCKMTKRKHLRKWEWWPNGPHFHFEAQQSLTSGKNNVWILQFLFLPPLLLLRPQVPPILKPEASLIRPKVPMVFLSRGTSSLGACRLLLLT